MAALHTDTDTNKQTIGHTEYHTNRQTAGQINKYDLALLYIYAGQSQDNRSSPLRSPDAAVVKYLRLVNSFGADTQPDLTGTCMYEKRFIAGKIMSDLS